MSSLAQFFADLLRFVFAESLAEFGALLRSLSNTKPKRKTKVDDCHY